MTPCALPYRDASHQFADLGLLIIVALTATKPGARTAQALAPSALGASHQNNRFGDNFRATLGSPFLLFKLR